MYPPPPPRAALIAGVVLCGLGGFLPLAQAATITFDGEVASQTCVATINGNSNAVVLLPTVNVKELDGSGKHAGLTPFTLHLTGCAAFAEGDTVKLRLLGQAVTSAGWLGNTATDHPASHVAIELLQDAAGNHPIHLAGGVTDTAPIQTTAGETGATHVFAARYVSTDAAVTAGKVTAVVEYTISYL